MTEKGKTWPLPGAPRTFVPPQSLPGMQCCLSLPGTPVHYQCTPENQRQARGRSAWGLLERPQKQPPALPCPQDMAQPRSTLTARLGFPVSPTHACLQPWDWLGQHQGPPAAPYNQSLAGSPSMSKLPSTRAGRRSCVLRTSAFREATP